MECPQHCQAILLKYTVQVEYFQHRKKRATRIEVGSQRAIVDQPSQNIFILFGKQNKPNRHFPITCFSLILTDYDQNRQWRFSPSPFPRYASLIFLPSVPPICLNFQFQKPLPPQVPPLIYTHIIQHKISHKQSYLMFGTIPNTTPSPTPPAPAHKISLIAILQKQLSSIPQDIITLFCRKVYPVQAVTSNAYYSLYKTLSFFVTLHIGKGYNYEGIVNELVRIATGINQSLTSKIGVILKMEQVKNRLMQAPKKNSSTNEQIQGAGTTNNGNSNVSGNGNGKKSIGQAGSLLQCLGSKYNHEYGNKYDRLMDGSFRKDTATVIPVQEVYDCSASVADKFMKERNQMENLLKWVQNKEGSGSRCLICESEVVQGEGKNGRGFRCRDCNEYYHRKCMPRDNNCAVCQLNNINPLQKVAKPLFLGILRKGAKKHQLQFSFQLSDSPTTTKQKPSMPSIQLRCLRLKQTNDPVSNFINLFPDACTIMINNRLVKQFVPLHKQSSLKYRRDECVKISSNTNIGSNKIVITERVLKKDIKQDERIEPDNHLVGVYIVDSLPVPKPANKLELFLNKSGYNVNNVDKFLSAMGCAVSEFSNSEILLKESLFIGQENSNAADMQDQQLVCDSVKVPLVCSLTLQKMKYPGRTIFCKHFACFDVYNFILLNSQAKLAKWQCPICKASAYRFEIDCILSSILQELNKLQEVRKSTKNHQPIKQDQQVVEVQFNRNMEIKLINSQNNVLISKKSKLVKDKKVEYFETDCIPYWISNIYDLSIEGKNKRQRDEEQNDDTNKKQKRTLNQMLQAKMSQSAKKKQKPKEKEAKVAIEDLSKLKQCVKSIISNIKEQESIEIQQPPKEIRKQQQQPYKIMDFYIHIEKYDKKPQPVEEQPAQRILNHEIAEENQQNKEKPMVENQEALSEKQEIDIVEIGQDSQEKQYEVNEQPFAKPYVPQKGQECQDRQENPYKANQGIFPQEINLIHDDNPEPSKSYDDEQIQQAIREYQQGLQRMQKVKKAGFLLPKVVNMDKLKGLDDNSLFANLNPNSISEQKPAEQKAPLNASSQSAEMQAQKQPEQYKVQRAQSISQQAEHNKTANKQGDKYLNQFVNEYMNNKANQQMQSEEVQSNKQQKSSSAQKQKINKSEATRKKQIKSKYNYDILQGYQSEGKVQTRANRKKFKAVPRKKEKVDNSMFLIPDDADVIELSD